MSTTLDASTSPTDTRQSNGERIQSPPAFLDLADSVRASSFPIPFLPCILNAFLALQAARLGGNMTDLTAVGVFTHPAGSRVFS